MSTIPNPSIQRIEERLDELENELKLVRESVAAARNEAGNVPIFHPNKQALTAQELGLSAADASLLQQQFVGFADWNDPAMDIYDQIYTPIVREKLKKQTKNTQK